MYTTLLEVRWMKDPHYPEKEGPEKEGTVKPLYIIKYRAVGTVCVHCQ